MIQNKTSIRKQKAVSVVIGALLMLSILVLAAAQYQTQVIPVQEEETEIQHNRLIQNQLAGLNSQIISSGTTGDVRTQQLQLGTTFESRIIFGIIPAINQPSPAGSLEYQRASNTVQLKNATGLPPADDYWDGTRTGNFETGFLTYEPQYRHFQDAPTTYIENGLVVDEYDDGGSANEYLPEGDQNLVEGNNITIGTLTSDVNINTIGTRTAQTYPVSAPSQVITIEADNPNDPIELEVPTRMDEDTWDSLLESEIDDGNINDISVDPAANLLTINLQSNQIYTLKMSRIHITTREEATPIPSEDAQYIAWDSDAISIREESRNLIQAQVRDRFNNPVVGVETEALATDQNGNCIGNFESPVTGGVCPTLDQPGGQVSGEDGQVRYIYNAPTVDEDTSIDITIDLAD